jgi:hypothetical protein
MSLYDHNDQKRKEMVDVSMSLLQQEAQDKENLRVSWMSAKTSSTKRPHLLG